MSVLTALSISRKPALAFAVVGLFWGTFAAFVPETKARLGASDVQFGLLLLGNAFGLVTAMWIAPRFDRWLGPSGLQWACALFAATFLLPGILWNPTLFFCGMIVIGIASGLSDVLMNARVGDLEATYNRPLMNANHGVFSLAYAVSALVTGAAREAQVEPFVVFSGWTVVVLGIASAVRIEVIHDEAETEVRGRYPMWPILLCGLVVLVAFMTEATVETWSALHIERTLDGGAAEGALGPAMLGLTMAFGRFSGQAVSERFAEYTVIFWATMMASAGALIAAVAPTPIWAYLGFGVLGLGVSVIGPLGLALVGKMVSAAMRTEAISKAAVMGFSGFFIAPVLMGSLSEWGGLRVAYACVAIFTLLLLPLLYALRRYNAKIES